MTPPLASWLSCHLYYHGDQELLLSRVVAPLVRDLLDEGRVDRFFFVRYGLGGPHLRLRLRLRDPEGLPREVEREVESRMDPFLAAHPSRRTVPAEEIHRRNRVILASDPFETDDRVHPDGSLLFVPFIPEAERYGGDGQVEAALDFFALSSHCALDHLVRERAAEAGRRLAQQLRFLIAQAQGSATSAEDFLEIVGYAAAPAADRLAPLLARADDVAERQRPALEMLVMTQLEAAAAPQAEPAGPALLARGARLLALALDELGPARSKEIAIRQLHMTANRLGLSNAEESYASRLLRRTVAGLSPREPAPFGTAAAAAQGALPARQALAQLVSDLLQHPGAAGAPAPPIDLRLGARTASGG